MKNAAEQAIWKSLIRKCHDANHPEYKNYGAQGVTVADEWRGKGKFQTFLNDVGAQPFPKAGLRRIDASRGFEPGNVEWANTRPSHDLTYNGKKQSIAKWATELDVDAATLRARVHAGWPTDKVLTSTVAAHFPNRGKRLIHTQ